MSKDEFEIEWKKLGTLQKPYLKYIFQHQDGFLLNWSAENFTSSRALFIKKIDNEFKITEKVITKDETSLQDITLYLEYAPLIYKQPKILKSFKSVQNEMTLILKLSPKNQWIHIFKKEDHKWKLIIALKDNDQDNFSFADNDNKEGIIQIIFRPEHFTKDLTHELLILESNFPMQDILEISDFKSNWTVKS